MSWMWLYVTETIVLLVVGIILLVGWNKKARKP